MSHYHFKGAEHWIEGTYWECLTMFISICFELISCCNYNNVKTGKFSKTLENCGLWIQTQTWWIRPNRCFIGVVVKYFQALTHIVTLKPRAQSFLSDREHVYWGWSHCRFESKPIAHKVNKRATWPSSQEITRSPYKSDVQPAGWWAHGGPCVGSSADV